MTRLIQSIEKINSQLEFELSKVQFPEIYKTEDIQSILDKLTEEKARLSNDAAFITEINMQKQLMYSQLNEYIDTLEKSTIYPFSKKQGLSYPKFYLAVLSDLQNILHQNVQGLVGVSLNTTKDPNDAVYNKEEFVTLLKQKRAEIHNASNLYDLYLAYSSLSKEIKSFTD